MSATILLVESYEDDEVLTRRAFARYGIENEIVVARSGTEAIELLRGGLRPIVAMIEPALPILTGPELLTHIRTDAQVSRTPVIMLVSHADERVAGGDRLTTSLQKPITFAPLIDAMNRFGLRFADGSSRNGAWVGKFAG